LAKIKNFGGLTPFEAKMWGNLINLMARVLL
jgi:hypothetical protein